MNLPVPIQTSVLCDADRAVLFDLAPSIQHSYRVRQYWHTDTEVRVSTFNELHFPTPASRYFQALREQAGHLDAFCDECFEWRRNEVMIRKLAHRMTRWYVNRFDRQLAQVEHDRLTTRNKALERNARKRVEAIALWDKHKQEQIAADPTFDREDVNAHQLVSYTKEFIQKAANLELSRAGPGEVDNVVGKLRSALRLAVERGVLREVFDGLQADIVNVAQQQLAMLPALPK